MQITGQALRVRIYIGESDRHGHAPLYMAIVERLKTEGAAGATVTRGLAGFGAHSRIHTATILRLSEDLPVLIEWVDRPDRVERILPMVESMVREGLITVDEVRVRKYAHRVLRNLPQDIRVDQVMVRDVATVGPRTPVADIIATLIGRAYQTLPVVDRQNHLLGIITDGDLLRRAGVPTAAQRQALTGEAFQALLEALYSKHQVAEDIMTREVVTLTPATSLAQAMHTLAAHHLKRLPVVDADGRIQGILSRVDVLRAVGQRLAEDGDTSPTGVGARNVGEIMQQDVPTVLPDTPLPDVVDSLLASRQRRAVVVDKERRVLGIITDGDLVSRAGEPESSWVVGRLQGLVGTEEKGEARWRWSSRRTRAANVMTPNPICVRADATPQQALALVLAHGIKRLPVIDEQGRLVGLVGRAGLLTPLLA